MIVVNARDFRDMICHAHNLIEGTRTGAGQYGIRITLAPCDPLNDIIGADWSSCRWYTTAQQRDEAMRELTAEPPYARIGDRPSIRCEPI